VVCRDPTPSDTPSDWDSNRTVPFADDSKDEEEQDADCVLYTGRFSEDRNVLVEEWIRCAKYFRWTDTLCWYGGRFLFVSLVRDKRSFVLPLHL